MLGIIAVMALQLCALDTSSAQTGSDDDVDIPGPYFETHVEADPNSAWLEHTDGSPKKINVNLSFEATGERALTSAAQDTVFVVDWSRSMDIPDPHYRRVDAVQQYIDDMAGPDRGALVKFAVDAKLKSHLTRDHERLKRLAEQYDEPGGGTNFEKAISVSTDELIENGNHRKQWVEIILTDGRPTENVTLSTMKKVWDNQISIFTIGLGKEVDTKLLRWLANSTGGEYYNISEADDLLGTYLNISDQIHTSLAGRNITVRADFNDNLNVGYSNFSKEPSYIDFQGGSISAVWNLSRTMKLGDSWDVSFSMTIQDYGWTRILKKTSGIYYVKPWDFKNNYTSFPGASVYGVIRGGAPPPPPPGSSPPPPPPVDTFPVPSSSLGMSTSPQLQPVSLFVAVFVALGIGEAVSSRLKVQGKHGIKMHSGIPESEFADKEDKKMNLGYICNER
ncbi:MAG: vWA domain-containing protein [Thermoplasmata archaeon]